MLRNQQVKLIVIVTLFLISVPQTAYAYIDPGTGSSIIQVLLAAVIGIPFLIKAYWKRIKAFFSKKTNN